MKQGNAALDELKELRASGSPDPARLRGLEKALAFNVSGHLLHSVFWPTMSPDGGGEPDGEPLRPGLLHSKPDAFQEIQAGLQEDACADEPHLVRRQQLHLVQQEIDEMALRIDSQGQGKAPLRPSAPRAARPVRCRPGCA